MGSDWAKLTEIFTGDPGGDWVQWELLERDNGEGAIFEFYRYVDLHAENWCRLVRTLDSRDVELVRPFVRKWFPLLP
ncbi:MAG TPA: hypothetical protein VG055_03275 [Planctomycetaceae bacterium]|jgi:hypothetical protein|nr:hypothetical protein [Planctomycetaceae bacterium]